MIASHTAREYLAIQEREYLIVRSEMSGWNLREAAKSSGYSLATFYRRLKRLGLNPKRMSEQQNDLAIQEHARGDGKLTKFVRVEFLLRFFGVEINPDRNSVSFWGRPRTELGVLLYDAKRGYLEMAKRYHPDAGNGEGSGKMAKINDAWKRLETAFQKHGIHP